MDISISLPDEVQPFVEDRAVAEGYASANEYLLALIRQDQQRRTGQSVLERMGGMPEHLLNNGGLSNRQMRRGYLAEMNRVSPLISTV